VEGGAGMGVEMGGGVERGDWGEEDVGEGDEGGGRRKRVKLTGSQSMGVGGRGEEVEGS